VASTADRVARRQPWQAGRTRLLALVAVLGPGLLAGLSDDDPAGITTYSVLGAQYGYELLWVLLLATVALIVFHDLGARMGVVTGQGLIGLIRQRYGVRAGGLALVVLVLANIGTTCAEFAGIAAGFELFGVARYLSVPIAAVVVSVVVMRGSFHRVEHILIGLATVFVAYIAAGFLGGPDWAQALHGLVVPAMPLTRDAVLIATATASVAAEPVRMSCLRWPGRCRRRSAPGTARRADGCRQVGWFALPRGHGWDASTGQQTGDSIVESPVVAGERWYAARESNPQPAD